MGRYIGELGTDVYGVTLDEGKLGVLDLSATQAAAATTDSILKDKATSASETTTATTFLAQPPYPRNLQITPGGTTAGVPAGNVVVTGTNINGDVITENFAFLANATAATVGAKAFKTVTSILFPIQDEAGATYSVGFGDKIGLPLKLAYNAVLGATLNGVRETTFPTVTYSSSVYESNTVDLNSNLAGTAVKIFLAL